MNPATPPRSAPYPPPGQLIDLPGETGLPLQLHLHRQGQGGPVVVLEAAIWDFSPTWALVQPGVARFAQAVAYDRAGLGWSAPSARPRTAAVMVAELRALLRAAGLQPPYVLVGQSFSGLLVRLFAYQHPQEVAGLVLLDPAHEDQFQRFPAPIQAVFAPLKDLQLQQLRQVRDLVAAQGPAAAPPLLSVPAGLPAETAAAYRAQSAADGSRFDTMIAELEALEASQAEVRAARSAGLGDLPLMVLSHGQAAALPGQPDAVNAAYEASWQQMQAELAALSTQGQRRVLEHSGHMVHHDAPEAVVAAIQRVVAAARVPA